MVEGVLYPEEGELVSLECLHGGQSAIRVRQRPGPTRPADKQYTHALVLKENGSKKNTFFPTELEQKKIFFKCLNGRRVQQFSYCSIP
jgi:hypothetical protein